MATASSVLLTRAPFADDEATRRAADHLTSARAAEQELSRLHTTALACAHAKGDGAVDSTTLQQSLAAFATQVDSAQQRVVDHKLRSVMPHVTALSPPPPPPPPHPAPHDAVLFEPVLRTVNLIVALVVHSGSLTWSAGPSDRWLASLQRS